MKQMLLALLLVLSIPMVPLGLGYGISLVFGWCCSFGECWMVGFTVLACGVLVAYFGWVAWTASGAILEK